MLYPCYKGIRELFWVKHSSYTIDNSIKIKLRIDTDIFGFMDFNSDKTISITNSKTKAKMSASYISLESDLYFFIDTLNSKKVLSVVDQFAGQNVYEISSLQLLNKVDAFIGFAGGDGCNDECLKNLGKPYLIYDNAGFHK